jgi:hypothetical protein
MWEELECSFNEGKEYVNLLRVRYNGARARKGCCQRSEGPRLVGQVCCESIVCGLESSEESATVLDRRE